jgi:uracil-DNA glycosylase
MILNLAEDWKSLLKDEFEKKYFKDLIFFLEGEYASKSTRTLPAFDQVFSALNVCPFDKVKVVILGQDPYPTFGHAHGLCFSVEPKVKPFPKSLGNVFKEIESDLGIAVPQNGNLMRWAEQGVLMLNTVLTVSEGKPESHLGKGWEIFTDEIIALLNTRTSPVVFLLWGAKANAKTALLDLKKHYVLAAPHPSPLSAYRGFFGCRHFSKTNEILLRCGQTTINW